MTRPEMLNQLHSHTAEWDIIIVGGGATGVGVAIDAASRGYDTLLLEGSDFGKGTSSRSTKLVHGGARYLEQGNVSLVMEGLKERGMLHQNAPRLVSDLAFIVPNYDWWEAPFYGLGLKIYNILSGKYGFGPSKLLSREETRKRVYHQADQHPWSWRFLNSPKYAWYSQAGDILVNHNTSLDKEIWARSRSSTQSSTGRGRRTQEPEQGVGICSPMFRAQTWEISIQLIGCSLLAVVALLLGSPTPVFSQQPEPSPLSAVGTVRDATHVLGLENIKRGARGRLALAGNSLRFYVGTATEEVSIPSIQDVFTGQDSRQLVRGKKGTVAKLAMPYGSGRALSLFGSAKIDVLTLEYRDPNGGLHGVIFTLPKGQAAAVKRQLVEKGAHASMPPQALAKP
jgi:hypothetical protein